MLLQWPSCEDGFVCCNVGLFEFTLDRLLLAKPSRHDVQRSRTSSSGNPDNRSDKTTTAPKRVTWCETM